MRDPLEDWIREVAALTDTFSLQQPGVDRTCLGLEVVEVVQTTLQPRSLGALMVVFATRGRTW